MSEEYFCMLWNIANIVMIKLKDQLMNQFESKYRVSQYTRDIRDNITNNNVVFFLFSDLKIVYSKNY